MTAIDETYDQWAPTYDTASNPTRDLDGEVLRREALPWGLLDVLEVGCGTGRNSAWLTTRCRSLIGLDLSAGMLARARQAAPGARLVRADLARPWPVAEACVDLVAADLVLEHLEDLTAFAREAARVLRSGGRVRVCELHPERQRRGGQAHFVRDGERVYVPAHRPTVSGYVRALITAGFVIESLDEHLEAGAPADAPPRLLCIVARKAALSKRLRQPRFPTLPGG